VEFSGDFVTLFFLVMDRKTNTLDWVRAGHDPAVIYDPSTDSLEMLTGQGIALGMDAASTYVKNCKKGLAKGQIILLGTDGVWEAQNAEGKRIGKNTVYEVVRKNHAGSAQEILDALFATVQNFQHGAKKEDDITAVVIKIRD
jgi:sigma-B regulation protein RsbU (phosphoserine phosphatase)